MDPQRQDARRRYVSAPGAEAACAWLSELARSEPEPFEALRARVLGAPGKGAFSAIVELLRGLCDDPRQPHLNEAVADAIAGWPAELRSWQSRWPRDPAADPAPIYGAAELSFAQLNDMREVFGRLPRVTQVGLWDPELAPVEVAAALPAQTEALDLRFSGLALAEAICRRELPLRRLDLELQGPVSEVFPALESARWAERLEVLELRAREPSPEPPFESLGAWLGRGGWPALRRLALPVLPGPRAARWVVEGCDAHGGLRELSLALWEQSRREASEQASAETIASLARATLPAQLERLSLDIADAPLAPMALPRLRRLDIDLHLPRDASRSRLVATMPELACPELQTLRLHGPLYEGLRLHISPADGAALASPCPRLEALEVFNTIFEDGAFAPLAARPLVALDLQACTVDEDELMTGLSAEGPPLRSLELYRAELGSLRPWDLLELPRLRELRCLDLSALHWTVSEFEVEAFPWPPLERLSLTICDPDDEPALRRALRGVPALAGLEELSVQWSELVEDW